MSQAQNAREPPRARAGDVDVAYRDDSAARRRFHALLDNVRIASPCTARWDDMDGDDRVRQCRDCQRHVFNLSAMRAEDAATLLSDERGKKCLRLYRRTDGTVMTADCQPGAHRRRVRRAVALSTAGVMSTAFITALQPDPSGIRAQPVVVEPIVMFCEPGDVEDNVPDDADAGAWIVGEGG